MLFASVPILTSEYKGPIRGAVIFGRYLDAAVTQKLSEITLYSITVHPVDDLALPADVR